MKCRGSSETHFPKVWGRTEPSSRGKRPFEVAISFFAVERWNVGDRLKRMFPKFEAERSHPRGVNGCSKFRIFQKCETLNGRLPPELRSYSRETWGKPVSDDSAHFVFWRRKFFGGIFRDGLLDDQRFDGLDRRYFQSAHSLRFEPAVCGSKAL